MGIKKQVALRHRREPLQIQYPPDFTGEKSEDSIDDSEFYISNQYRILTLDEIKLVEEHFKQLPYKQELNFGATLIDPEDAMLAYSHEDISTVEQAIGLPDSQNAPGGGQRSILDRVLLIRESGYYANGKKALAAAAAESNN